MKKQWSDIAGLPVVTAVEEPPLGSLRGLFMNPENGQVIGFLVGFTRVLTPVDIERYASDYVKVSDPDCLTPLPDILRLRDFGVRRTYLNGKKVLSKSGRSLGHVHDFTLETSTSAVVSFETCRSFIWWEWDQRVFSYKEVDEVTDKYIRLNVEPEQKVKERAPVPATAA